MMKIALLLCCAATLLALSPCAAMPVQNGNVGGPSAPNWGGNDSLFAWEALVNMTDVSDAPEHPNWTFKYFYNWNSKASRYEHQQGQHDEVCAKANIVDDECTVLNAADGNLYLFSNTQCCRCSAPWAPFTIRPDWLQDDSPKYTGRVTMDGQLADGWVAYGSSDNHYYASTDSSRRPIRYLEHKNGKLKTWEFLKWIPGAPQSDKFATPENCQTPCPASPNGCTGQ